jgi:dihydropteroate synthase
LKLVWDTFCLDFTQKTHLMGILNVTPDSFSDGSLYFAKSAAVDRALRMVDEGADIIDIGGESSRPGSDPVSQEEELSRTIPVIESISGKIRVPISIDTNKAEVARNALEAGASIVNDISGMRYDSEMPNVVSKYQVPIVLMHMKGNPKVMQISPSYEALIPEILEYLRIGISRAVRLGVREDRIIIDPGIGFGKTCDHNLEIINNLQQFIALEKPLLIGPSRKAFLGKILGGAPASKRLEATAAAVAISIIRGANIIRVHDVKEMAKVARIVDAIKRQSIPTNLK